MNTGGMARIDGMTGGRQAAGADPAAGGAAAGIGAAAARLLIVEDEPKLAALMTRYLEAAGYLAATLADGRLVVPQVRAEQPDLVLLDLMLPGRDGIEICRELRTF